MAFTPQIRSAELKLATKTVYLRILIKTSDV